MSDIDSATPALDVTAAAPIVEASPVEIAGGVFVIPDSRVPLVPNIGVIVYHGGAELDLGGKLVQLRTFRASLTLFLYHRQIHSRHLRHNSQRECRQRGVADADLHIAGGGEISRSDRRLKLGGAEARSRALLSIPEHLAVRCEAGAEDA